MPSPYDWLPLAAALDDLDVVEGGPEAAAVESSRKAACAFVERARGDLFVGTDTDADGVPDVFTFTPGDDVVKGALLLTSRLYARKGTPAGIATFGELGAATILRTDPDVQMLLGLGRYATPRIG